MRLKLPKSESVKAFRLAIQNTAYSFWVNDSLLAMTGKFGTSKESMEPKYLPRTFEFYTKEDNLSIVMNVSNFHNRFGGVRTPIEFGLSRDIKVARERSIALDLFIFSKRRRYHSNKVNGKKLNLLKTVWWSESFIICK